jgi:hypothetical protein
MKEVLGGILIAVIASLVTLYFAGTGSTELDDAALERLAERLAASETMQASLKPTVMSFTEPSEQDSWLNGAARDGSPRPGPAVDEKPLADSANAVCFLTKVEFERTTDGNGAACYISIDEFTGWWQINAEQGNDSIADVACNARCIVWE